MPPSFYFILASLNNNSVPSTIADSASSHVSSETGAVPKVGHLNTDSSQGVEEVRVQQAISRPIGSHGLTIEPNEFFFRPVVVQTIAWSSASTITNFNVFKQWVNNPIVLTHLQGISRLRVNLRVRVEMSTNPYAYGKAVVCFCPGVTTVLAALYSESSYVVASSRPGVEIDAAVPGAKEFVIPWHLKNDTINVCVGNGFEDCGVVRFHNGLYGRADGAAGDSTVVISAWPEQLWLYGPTRVSAVAQSYSGPIEARARRAASIMSSLSSVPLVGAYASAAASVAGAVGNVASLFGWSRPHMPDEIRGVTVRQGNLALTDGHDTASQLSTTLAAARAPDFDDLGINADECAIASMAGRSAFIASYAVATTDVVGTSLGTLFVTPTMAVRVAAGPPAEWALPPLAWVSLPFRRWRGTLKYTFKVVCSSFHNGAVNISYEPNHSGALAAGTSFSSLESCTLDLRPGSEATVHVRWSAPISWLPIDTGPTTVGSTPAVDSNGRLIFTVARTLETSASSNAYIFAYVSAGDDFQLFDLREDFPMWGDRNVRTSAAAQSLVSTFAGGKSECSFGGEPFATAELTAKSAGERIVSIRSLLKRYQYMGTVRAASDSYPAVMGPKYFQTPLPMSPPNYDISNLTGTCSVEWTTYPDPYRYFRRGFLGQSGSVRYRIIDGEPNRDYAGNAAHPASYTMWPSQILQIVTAAALSDEQIAPSASGAVLAEGHKDEAGDFRFCDSSPWRYLPVGMQLPYIATGDDRVFPVVDITKVTTDATKSVHSVMFAVGDDFSFYYFMGGFQGFIYS